MWSWEEKRPLFSLPSLVQRLLWLLPSWEGTLYLTGCWMPSQWTSKRTAAMTWGASAPSGDCWEPLLSSGSESQMAPYTNDTNICQFYLESSPAKPSATSCPVYITQKPKVDHQSQISRPPSGTCSAHFMLHPGWCGMSLRWTLVRYPNRHWEQGLLLCACPFPGL